MKSSEKEHLRMRLFHKSKDSCQKIKTKFLKTNVNRIFITAKRNFISGKLHFGTLVNTLSVNICVFFLFVFVL